jgi:hypothetical protein
MKLKLKLKQLSEAASLFYSTPKLHLRGVHKTSHPLYESAHRKKARHVCQWIACDAGYKQSDVARFWGMNHATVIYGCKAVANRTDTSPAEKRELKKFMKFAKEHISRTSSK